MPKPTIVSRDEWTAARKRLLVKEKELTRQRDALSAERRKLPMVAIEKEYVFEGPDVRRTLVDLFGKQTQLIVYHFMFGLPPDWEDEGCPSCSYVVDNLSGSLVHLAARDTAFAPVSAQPEARPHEGEREGLSVFLRDGNRVFHTYSTYQRGLDHLLNTYNLLDLAPLGRQEEDGIMHWLT